MRARSYGNARRPRAAVPVESGLGTFLGVFTPSILTILGVVLFLRTGWVVGNVGLLPALSIIVLAHVITFATALSVSAIATNMRVGAGGAYFMISRSLGLEIGGAIGVPLFLAQTFSLTLYAFGLAEAVQLLRPELPQVPIAAVTIVVVSLVSGRSADLALKLQIPIMIAIGLALASLGIGAIGDASRSLPLFDRVTEGPGYWTVFAVFFPAVTGLMAGISLSGDLKNPTRSIPRGTMFAVTVGFFVYLAVPVALAVSRSPQELVGDNLIWLDIAIVPAVILPGLIGAVLSSAVGSMLGAPRTLEALIDDGVVPGLRRRFKNPRTRRALPHVVATIVALLAVLLGDLNAVAPILTMFFLTTYGVVNLVAVGEQLAGSPSYRPAIAVPWFVSLIGALGCLGVMLLISPIAAIVALALELLIYRGLRRRSIAAAWGDLRYGAIMSLTRTLLLRLRRLPIDPRNWRPHILVFAGDLQRRIDLVRYGSWLNQGRGILTVSQVLIGELEERCCEVPSELEDMNRILAEEEILAFPEVEVAPDFEAGALQVIQANGIAGITSNTLMLGWREDPGRLATVLRICRRAGLLEKSTVICKLGPRRWPKRAQRIDVWWGGLQNNGDMLLLFAHLIQGNREWSHAQLHVKAIATSQMTHERIEAELGGLLERTRINAKATVLARPEGETVRQVIQRESEDADLVFLGVQKVGAGEEMAYAERLAQLVGDLPTVLLVHAAGPFAGRLLGEEREEPRVKIVEARSEGAEEKSPSRTESRSGP